MSVGSFSADLLARNPLDGSLVLIENQLEQTDHNHLGQILTYLAGLEAQVIVWIASDFRDPHLSAIHWLNDHTVDPFAFFAVQVKAVRIGDSPIAPLFEVVAKPNGWDRKLQQQVASPGRGAVQPSASSAWPSGITCWSTIPTKRTGVRRMRPAPAGTRSKTAAWWW